MVDSTEKYMNRERDAERVTYFAATDARNRMDKFGIKAKDRTRHVYVIGKTGMGKSTMLENMAIQDIANGQGIAFVDPHGSSAEKFLDYIPESRIKDVLYFAPFDMEYPVAFNVMEDVGYDKRHLVVSGLMSAFKKIWVDMWSARMEYILSNTVLALLEYPGATLLDVNRMLVEKAYRKKVVENVKDALVKSFWVDEFATFTDRYTQEATPAIQNKIGQFTSNPLIRNIIGQSHSTFDIREMMDHKKIIIANLSKGRMGETNANLLGSMLITKIYLAAMSRADTTESVMAGLPNYYFYVDEFQSFANESFANILSEARKYNLNLTIAHQYIEQMSEEVRAAVFGNVGTLMSFRVGAFDAEILEKEFAPQFTAEDMVNLGFAQIYLKLMIDGISSPPFSAVTLPPTAKPQLSYKDQVIEWSHQQYTRPRSLVEEDIHRAYDDVREEAREEELVRQREASRKNEERQQRNREGGARQGWNRSRPTYAGERPRSVEQSRGGDRLPQQRRSNERYDRQPQRSRHEQASDKRPSQRPTEKRGDSGRKQEGEQRSELRDALADALRSAGAEAANTKDSPQTSDVPKNPPKSPTPPHTPAQSQTRPAPPFTQSSKKAEGVNEVPESVLRKVLEADD
jgi:hypothetical protein